MTKSEYGSDRRKKSLKCLAYVAAFVVFQTGIILLFVMLVMKIRDPKVRIASVSVANHNISSSSFNLDLMAKVTVKNTNFGHFKFENSTAIISYLGTPVGEATILKARARARSTKKFNVTAAISSSKLTDNTRLRSDLNSGVLKLTSTAKLSGKIHLFVIFKKKKSAEMNCTMDLNTKTNSIENLSCKWNSTELDSAQMAVFFFPFSLWWFQVWRKKIVFFLSWGRGHKGRNQIIYRICVLFSYSL